MEDDKSGKTLLNNLEQVTLDYEDQPYLYESYVNTQRMLYNVCKAIWKMAANTKKLQIMLRRSKFMDPK